MSHSIITQRVIRSLAAVLICLATFVGFDTSGDLHAHSSPYMRTIASEDHPHTPLTIASEDHPHAPLTIASEDHPHAPLALSTTGRQAL